LILKKFPEKCQESSKTTSTEATFQD